MNEPVTPGIARLLGAEREADEIVRRAREAAEETLAEAKRRAQQIREGRSSVDVRDAAASRSGEEAKRQRLLIIEEGEKQMETMRVTAEARLNEAVEKLLAVLVGES